jgi:heptosyltransferase-2
VLKQLELAWRRLWIRVLTALLPRPPRGERLDWGSRPHRVLFLRHDRLGDMILSTGVLRAIARSHPTIELDVLASPGNAPILRAEPWVHETLVFDRRRRGEWPAFVRALRARRYDAVIDCMVTAPSLTTLLLIWASGARHRVGIAGRGNDAAFSILVPQRPEARHIAELLATLALPFGVPPEALDARPAITLTDDERTRGEAHWRPRAEGQVRALVNVSAGRDFRRWPEARFVEVLAHLRRRLPAIELLVVGSPDERERAERIAAGGGGRYVATAGIRDVLALVATADLVFTPDTSVAHAASAFRVPAVAMYIRGTVERWGLYGTEGTSLESPDGTLDSLDVPRVTAALDALVGRMAGSE